MGLEGKHGETRVESGGGWKNHTTSRGCVRVWGLYGGLHREGRQGEKYEVIRFESYNIWNSRNVNLDTALCGIDQANIVL